MLSIAACTSTAGERDIVRTSDTIQPAFLAADQQLLDEVQYATFQFLWKEVGTPACLARDTLKNQVASIAAVGFQLAALPIAVERGWITREQGATRATTVLRALLDRDDNKKFGMYLHFPDMNTGGPSATSWTSEISTVDSADVRGVSPPSASARCRHRHRQNARRRRLESFAIAPTGRISMLGAREKRRRSRHRDSASTTGTIPAAGAGRPLAAGSPTGSAMTPCGTTARRTIKGHADLPPFVVSWPGAPFTH